MKTYPVITRFADGTETAEVFDVYSPTATDAVETAKQNPAAREVELRRVKGDDEQTMTTWMRETAAHLGGAWFSR